MLVPTAEAMQALGVELGRLLRAGDLVILDGPLGAGKTTLARGIAEGLQVRGPVTSPTFVIARQHLSLVGGPGLIHVDAYRVQTWGELEDLGIGFDADTNVVVAEWAAGRMEDIADAYLTVHITRNDIDEVRDVTVVATGERWEGEHVPARD